VTFGQKLDLLMRITNTTNIALARSVSLDASFISRLRREMRTPARKENYVMAMAAYFARNCSTDYQRAGLSEALQVPLDNYPENMEEVTEFIYKWFLEEKGGNTNSIKNFVDNVAHFKFNKAPQRTAVKDPKANGRLTSDTEIFYGIEGKQAAVLAFLCLVLKNKKPQTLLLYSDEDLEWLTGNREFKAKWAELLSQAIMQGSRIKIIHNINRNLDEMLSAIKEWMPIYMTGAIEPYYYPKIRDGIFKRTLFIAPDTAALTSNSIEHGSKNTANFLITNKDAITTLGHEFNDFLSICRPLMHIFTPSSRENLSSLLAEFENERADSAVIADVPSSITLPLDIIKSMCSRMEVQKKNALLSFQQRRVKSFEDNLQKQSFTEIITYPNIEKIRAEETMFIFSDIYGDSILYYTPEEYSRHLQNIIRYLDSFDNYNVYLTHDDKTAGYMLYLKEDVGVIVGKTTLPSVIFAINESNLTAAFWDHARLSMNKKAKNETQKKKTIAEIERIIEKLEA